MSGRRGRASEALTPAMRRYLETVQDNPLGMFDAVGGGTVSREARRAGFVRFNSDCERELTDAGRAALKESTDAP